MRAAPLALLLLIGPTPATATVAQPAGPSITIVSPAEGATVVGPDIEVVLRAEGVALGGEPGPGGYALLRIDDLPPVKAYAEAFVFQGTEPGGHVLRAELRRTDGTRFDPPAEHEVRFVVAEGSRRRVP